MFSPPSRTGLLISGPADLRNARLRLRAIIDSTANLIRIAGSFIALRAKAILERCGLCLTDQEMLSWTLRLFRFAGPEAQPPKSKMGFCR
jgi:hypothetical protein